MLHTFQNIIINFPLTRSQYLLILFLGLSWLLLTSRALLLCRLQFNFSALISHLYWATSQSRSAKQTIKLLHSSLLPFAAQGVRSVRGKHVHNLCRAGQWLCLTCAWDSEGGPHLSLCGKQVLGVVPGGFPRTQWTIRCTQLWAVTFWKHWLGVMAVFMMP